MQIGVSCPRGLISHDECRRCSADPNRPCHLSPDILEMMRLDPNDRHADPDQFSPTGLLDCDRKAALTISGDWYVDVESAWPMVRGTLAHALMENQRYPGAVGILREQEMKIEVETSYGPQVFVGKPDLVVVQSIDPADSPDCYERDEDVPLVAHVKIVDYKSTNEIKHELTEARREHVKQVNMYAYLVSEWLPKHHTQHLQVVIDELEIIYLDFKKVRRFTSAGPLTAKGKRTSKSPLTYETLTLAPIRIYSTAVVARGVRRMIEDKIKARTELPLAYEPWEEDYWKCYSCQVRERCAELAERGL